MRNMKKIIAFLLAVCTIAGTMTSMLMVSGISVYADETNEVVVSNNVDAWSYFTTKYQSDVEKLHKMKKYIENDEFALYALEKTGEVAVENKITGQIMFSNPRDTYLYSTKTADDKGAEEEKFVKLASQLFVKFKIISTDAEQTLYSYTDAAMNNQITMSAIKNGVSVEYTLGRGDDRKLVPMNIEKSRYEENILDLIDDPNIRMRMSPEGGIYMLKDPTAVTETQRQTMYKDYPITKTGMAIYVCDEKISNYEINKIEGWIRAYAPKYSFEELEYDHELTKYVGTNKVLPVFKMALEYKLTEDGFTVRLPASSITFDEDYFRLESVTILPYMGAGSSQYEGFTLVPDGSGTIIAFEDVRNSNETTVNGDMYGPDNSYHTFSESYTGKMEIWRYPVFGMVEDFYRYYDKTTNKEYCGHSTLELVETVPPSCHEDGYSIYKCGVCGEQLPKSNIVAATHPASSLKVVAGLGRKSTCVNVSVDVSICTDCGEYVYKYGDALGTAHNTVTLDNGDKVCTLCNKYTLAGEAFKAPDGYQLSKEKSVEATCESFGKQVYVYVPAEGENVDLTQYPDIEVAVAPTGHEMQVKKNNPSCAEGYTEVSCKKCNALFNLLDYTAEKAPAGYVPDNRNSSVPNCTESGTIVFTKEGADNVEITVPAHHNYVIKTEIIDNEDRATYTVKYSAVCIGCNHETEDVTVVESPAGASVGDVYVSVEGGKAEKLIKNTPVKVTSKNPKHKYVKLYQVASNCAENIQGYTISRCIGCNHITVEANIGCHEWDGGVEMYPATTQTTGLTKYTCKSEGCGAVRYAASKIIETIETIQLDNVYLTMTGDEEATAEIVLKEFDYDLAEVAESITYSSSNAIVAVVKEGKIVAASAGQTEITIVLTLEDTMVYAASVNVFVESKIDESNTVLEEKQPENTYKKYDPRGWVAIITEGESLCTVTSSHGGTIHKYNSVYLTVNPRPSDTYMLTGALTVTGDAKYTVVSDRKYTGSYRIQYYMLSDQETSKFDASYAGMAKAYRHYLESTEQLKALAKSENIPLYLETLGSVMVPDTFLSIPITTPKALTTFDDIIQINEDLKKAGITNIQYRLTGYVNGGMNPTMPYDLEYEEVLGGNAGYKELIAYAKKNGIGIFTDYDFSYMHKNESFDGYQDSDHAVKAIDDRYIIKKNYNPTIQAFESTGVLAVSASVFDYFYTEFRKNDAKLGSIGISVSTIGTDLNSDFDRDDPYNREDSTAFIESVLAKMEKDYSENVMTDGGNSYVLPYAKHILNMSLTGSRRAKTSASVPFFSMVLHGAMNYAGKATNMASSLDEEVLHIIENGASPYFIIAAQNQSALKENNLLSKYYAVSYSHWKSDIVEVYNKINDAMGGLQNAVYNSHEYIIAERVPGQVEFTTERDKLIEEIAELFEKVEVAQAEYDKAVELLARFMEPVAEMGAAVEALTEKVNNGTATDEEKVELTVAINELATLIKSVNRYETNANTKKTALTTAENNRRKKLESVASLFNVTNALDQSQYTAENYKGYGTYTDGKFTPRAEDFIDDNGDYITTVYTVNDKSVVRTGWDKDGDKKDDVVILLNYNTFDVYVYEGGKPVVIPAMSFVVL